jgi:hypothetical protein
MNSIFPTGKSQRRMGLLCGAKMNSTTTPARTPTMREPVFIQVNTFGALVRLVPMTGPSLVTGVDQEE